MKKFVASLAVVGSVLIASPAFGYEVKSGDTLSQISNEHQVSINQILDLNPEIYDKNLIYVGQQLDLSGQASESQAPSQSQPAEAAQQPSSSNESTESTSTEAPVETSSNESSQAAAQPSSSNESSSESSSQSEGNVTTMNVEATAYTAYCEGCSGVTFTGIDLRANPNQKVIAVDPNVIPLGSTVYVEGYGEAIAGDIGGAITGNKIDLFMPDRGDALQFGRQNVTIHVYE